MQSSTIKPVDALAGLLEGPRAREAFLLRSVMDPPWSLRIEDEAPLTLVAVVRGEAWIHLDLGAGEPGPEDGRHRDGRCDRSGPHVSLLS